ncbi:hypothetical protein N8J89_31355 [Crossiella sp. CA-258035]|uniref:hypothetical protein n=1 Tax=Crossiella sp. CA-258035 TaxID=2981138 RepID=UPI0024BCEBA8|nr:hypothetical protein [Crossiella sp. CA-258035]WHT17592.1 hypothetical protein N8J89_31355 [Crossiella sp. CA-258035]
MAGSDTGYGGLAGDLFLRLAADGRLALDPAQAAVIVDELVRTLDSVCLLLRCADAEPRESAADWLIPGGRVPALDIDQPRLEAARRELPKYIEAFRLVRDRAS